MNQDTETRMWSKLDDMSVMLARIDERQKVTAESTKAIAAEVKQFSLHGCALAATHADHEKRIRVVESRSNRTMALSAGGGATVSAVLMTLLDWFWRKASGN